MPAGAPPRQPKAVHRFNPRRFHSWTNRVDCFDEFSFPGAGGGLGYRPVHGADKVYPSGTKEPLSRGQTLQDVTVLHAYHLHLAPRGSRRIGTMACSGRRRAAHHGPGGPDLGFAWIGNAVLCPDQHEFADVDRRD